MSEQEGKDANLPTAPRWLILARRLWIASALVAFLRTMVQFMDRRVLLDDLARMQPELSQNEIDEAANGTILFGLLLAALSLLVYVLLATRMVQGRNWARIVLTVFGGLNVFSTLVLLLVVPAFPEELLRELAGRTISGWELGISVLVMALNVAAIVCMYQRDSNRFIRELRPHLYPAGMASFRGKQW